MTIFLVQAESGEYSDYRCWPVSYANTKERAESLITNLTMRIGDFRALVSKYYEKHGKLHKEVRSKIALDLGPEPKYYPYDHFGSPYRWSKDFNADYRDKDIEKLIWEMNQPNCAYNLAVGKHRLMTEYNVNKAAEEKALSDQIVAMFGQGAAYLSLGITFSVVEVQEGKL